MTNDFVPKKCRKPLAMKKLRGFKVRHFDRTSRGPHYRSQTQILRLMAKLFLGLAIALMLAAAVLGFLAKGNIEKLQSSLDQSKKGLVREEGLRRKAEGELKKTQEDLTAANTKVESQTTEISGLKTKTETAEKALAETKAELETKSVRLATLEKQIEEVMKTPGGVPPEEMAKTIEQMRNDLTKAQAEAQDQKQLAESLAAQSRQKEEALASSQSEVNRYRANVTRQGLTGRVLAVNPGWNFVVLSVGDKQGAATGSTMVVTRGGEAIGKARITSVEPSTSIADLIPGSFRKGVSVQPGDVVWSMKAPAARLTRSRIRPGGARFPSPDGRRPMCEAAA